MPNATPTAAPTAEATKPAEKESDKRRRKQSAYRTIYSLTRLGSRLTPLESSIALALPFAFLHAVAIREWFLWNMKCQLALFVPVVLCPALITGRMAYVDIGWPLGVVVLGLNGLVNGGGLQLRRALMGGVLCLHGGRMALGALALFFPYSFEADLPRYRYAKLRFVEKERMPERLWTAKMVHDIAQQAYANCAVLAAPVALACSDQTATISEVELAGYGLWLAGYLWESLADLQKQYFIRQAQQAKRKAKFGNKDPASTQWEEPVLGLAPYRGWRYYCWSRCRHPNYFGEWAAWNGIVLAALPSLLRYQDTTPVRVGLSLALLFVSRFFYDCLLYWTGAEPAEHFSVLKRQAYHDYQRSTRVFWPFELPWVDHGRRPDWPAFPKRVEKTATKAPAATSNTGKKKKKDS